MAHLRNQFERYGLRSRPSRLRMMIDYSGAACARMGGAFAGCWNDTEREQSRDVAWGVSDDYDAECLVM